MRGVVVKLKVMVFRLVAVAAARNGQAFLVYKARLVIDIVTFKELVVVKKVE